MNELVRVYDDMKDDLRENLTKALNYNLLCGNKEEAYGIFLKLMDYKLLDKESDLLANYKVIFGGKDGVDLLNHFVGQLLDLVNLALLLVFGNLGLLLRFLDCLVGVAARVADFDTGLLGELLDLLRHVVAALLGEFGDGKANHLAVGHGRLLRGTSSTPP